MRRAPRLTSLLAIGVVALAAAPASTTTLIHLDVEQLASIATVVAVGDVAAVDARWDAARAKIYTRVAITPTEVLKGERGLGTLTVKTVGGRIGQDDARLPGAPEFTPGERVLVFLEPREDGDGFHVVGLFQGVFRLRRGADGEELLTQDPQPRGVTVVEGASRHAATRMLTLGAVRAIVKGGAR